MIIRQIRIAILALVATMAVSLPAVAGVPDWTIDQAASRLGFSATQSGTPFAGTFRKWDGVIAFSPDDLAHSSVKINVDLASVTTQDQDRDTNLPGADWFDIAAHPTAIFEAKSFRHIGGNRYEADGTLSLKGISKPVVLEFTLDIAGKQAKVEGQGKLDRMAFNVGVGQWAGDDVAGHQVQVLFTISAQSK